MKQNFNGNFNESDNKDNYDSQIDSYSNNNRSRGSGNVSFSQGAGTLQETLSSEVVWKTFTFMTLALLITTFAAYMTLGTGLIFTLLSSQWVFYGLILAELAVVFVAGSVMRRNMVAMSAVMFAVYSAINGITLSALFLVYDIGSITQVALTATVLFAIMAFVGLVTKKDLTSLGGMLVMGLIGIIAASVLNMVFFKSSGMDLMVSIIAVGVFLGLTAYDAQKTRKMALSNTGYSVNVLALYGAMNLYLDLINLILQLLRILGRRRN
jgi:FtsH-binding integral membrane protein